MPVSAISLVPAAMPRHRRLRVATMVFALVGLVTAVAASPTFAWSGSAFSPDDEALLLSLTNQDRASAGLNALVDDSYLHSKAEWRAQDMGDRDYFSHQIPPDGNMVFTYMQQDGYCFKVAGENIGLSTWGDDVATNQIETAFMGSADHRANILGSWARIGVGAYKAADGRKLYAVLFSIPCGVTVQPPATPVPPAATPVPPAATPVPPVATRRPTPRPTPVPTLAPTPVPTPTATPSQTPEPTATATPSAVPSASSSASAAGSGNGSFTSLRVREKSSSPGLLESFLHWLFGW